MNEAKSWSPPLAARHTQRGGACSLFWNNGSLGSIAANAGLRITTPEPVVKIGMNEAKLSSPPLVARHTHIDERIREVCDIFKQNAPRGYVFSNKLVLFELSTAGV
jgi:hypothetical protein